MKRLITTVVGAALMGGCAMKEFSSTPLYSGNEVKFTGAVEDRVNLWPLAYYREPVGSFAWPIVSWGNEHLAFRPLYSQYKQSGSGDYDEFNLLWPIGQFDTRHDDYRVFPFFWGKDYGDDPYFCLFPLLWWNDEFAGVFPLFWSRGGGGSGFCVFPLFWSETTDLGELWNTLWPLYFYKSGEGGSGVASESEFWALCYLAGFERCGGKFQNHRFLPLYFWDRGDFYSLPYARYTDGGRIKSRVLCGLAGCDFSKGGDYESSWLFPLYYNDNDSLLTPLFGKSGEMHWTLPLYYKDSEKLLTLLGGKSGDTDWIVPFYWRDQETFASLPYWQQRGNDGEIDSAFSLPLLSGYQRDKQSGDRLLYLLMGFGGHVWNDVTGGASWVFPLFYSDRESFYTLLYGHNPRRTWLFPFYFDGEERTYITPLYGRNKKKESEWLFPLYWRDKDSFRTPLYGRSGDSDWLFPIYSRDESQLDTLVLSVWNDAKKGTRGFFSLPLLSGASWEPNSCDYTWLSLAGLVGGTSNATGSHKCQWLAPLFYHDEDSFYSIPFGYEGGGSYTNTYFAAGLAGIRSGGEEGGWLFPLYNKEKDSDFDENLALLDADKLPDDIRVWTEIRTNEVWNSKTREYDKVVGPRQCAKSFYSSDNRTHFLVSDNDTSVSGDAYWSDLHGSEAESNKYHISMHHELGNILAFRYEGWRKVDFDLTTREKVLDTENGWSSLFLFLYNHEHRADKVKGTSYASHRVLWRLWDWEEENGDVSLDVFPGFTYDSKKNGYRKTSLLWRLFRYENDPEEGKKVDLLFIPVWR